MSDTGAGAQALTALTEIVVALNAIGQLVKSLPLPIVPAPATAASTGVAGSLAIDADFLYVCVAANTWKRVAIATW